MTQHSTEISRAYPLAIRFLAPRARSIREMQDYLKKKGFHGAVIDGMIQRLEGEKLLNDLEFAALFIEQRERFNPKSHYALAFELKKKGIDETIIQKSLEGIDEFESAWRAVQPKLRLWNSYDGEKFKKKIMNYLRNRGFSYSVCITTFEKAVASKDIEP